VEWFCYPNAATRRDFGSASWSRSDLPSPGPFKAWFVRTGDGEWFRFQSDFSAFMALLPGNCGTYDGHLDKWRVGTYAGWGELPVPHPDVYEALAWLAVQNVADLERVYGYAKLPAGTRWNPEPSPELFGPCYPDGCADPGNTDTDGDGIPDAEDPCPLNPNLTCGTSGGGDPGDEDTDPETRCSIVNIPCNLRLLFVPRTGMGTHWNRVKAAAEEKFPFNMSVRLVTLIRPEGENPGSFGGFFMNEEDTVAYACEVKSVNFSTATGTFLQEALVEQENAYNLCDNAYAQWMHDKLRGFLFFLCMLLMGWSVFTYAVRS
jgi:hypothetical protein